MAYAQQCITCRHLFIEDEPQATCQSCGSADLHIVIDPVPGIEDEHVTCEGIVGPVVNLDKADGDWIKGRNRA